MDSQEAFITELIGRGSRDMEIISGQDGEPIVQLHGKPYTGLSCKVSISHTQDTAIATAIIVK